VQQAQIRAEEAGKAYRVEYRVPREGAVMFFDAMAIPEDAEHVSNAHVFINYLLRPEVAVANSEFVSYPNGNLAAQPRLPLGLIANRNYFPTPEMQKKLVPDLPESRDFTLQLTRTWMRFRVGE
jgi:putrescine transport system substrate-binding protein